MARRLLDAVKRDLQDHLRLDDVHRSVSRLRDLFEMLRELIDLDVGQSRIRFADVDQLPVAKNGERVIGQHGPPFAVTVLRRSDNAIQRRQGFLVLQPRLPAASGRVDRIRIFDDQPFVRPCARSVEKLVKVLRIADGALIRQPNRAFSNNVAQLCQTFMQRQFEERPAIFVKQIKREERNRRIAQQRFTDLAPA